MTAVKAGLGFVPEERRTEGLILTKSLAFNVSLANLRSIVVHPRCPSSAARAGRALARARHSRALRSRRRAIDTPVGRLSGGNQQKVVIGRWLASKPQVLILDEPTRGVDVGARAEIHRLIRGLAASGMAVLVVSSEPEELPDICDRVLVMAEGRIVRELSARPLIAQRNRRGELRQAASRRSCYEMSDVLDRHRRLSPGAKAALGVFARYATIIGLVAMIVVFSILSPGAFPTFNNFINVLNQASLAMIIAGGLTLAVDRRRARPLDRLSRRVCTACWSPGLIVHDKLPIPLAIAHRARARRADRRRQRPHRHEAEGEFGDRDARRRHDHRRARLRLFGRRADRRRRSGRLPAALARPLAVRHPEPDHRHGPRDGGLWALVERTAIGQEIQAVGGNPTAARLAGINVDRIKILGFVISGVCAALTGVLLASRLGSGTTSAADSYLLTAFAAVFLGSATLRDGEFHVLGTFIGTLIIVFGFNGLNIFGAPTFTQYVFQGAILIVAVGLSSLGRMLAES